MKTYFTTAVLLLVLISAQSQSTSKGKEFWIGFMKNYEVEDPESLQLFVTGDQATSGIVSIPGQGWSQPFTLQPGITSTLTIPNNLAEVLTSETIEDRGVLLVSEDSVSVYAINFQMYTADGTRVLPIQTLGTHYRVAAYQGLDAFYDYNSEFLIVATEDETEINIQYSANTVGGIEAGESENIMLNAGQTYQVRGEGHLDDFTGTLITVLDDEFEFHPIAVFSGSDCANVPYGCFACDHLYEQNFPIETWGYEYIITPFDFASFYTYKLLAHEDETNVFIDGELEFTLDAGDYAELNNAEDAHCISSDKKFCVTQFMQGIGCAENGDPSMLVLSANDAPVPSALFSTVESAVLGQHFVNIIIKTYDEANVFFDGTLVSSSLFNPLDNCDDYSFATLTLTEGTHSLDVSSGDGFIGYVYGIGQAESYAYSVASNVISVAPQTDAAPILISFPGNVTVCDDENVVLEMWVLSDTPVTYQWYLNSVPIDGETSYSLDLNFITEDEVGTYYCSATNENGTVNSPETNVELISAELLELFIPDSICETSEPVLLSASIPDGFWAGQAVAGEYFHPEESGIGDFFISYTLTTETGCFLMESHTIEVLPQLLAGDDQFVTVCNNNPLLNLNEAHLGAWDYGGFWVDTDDASFFENDLFYPMQESIGIHHLAYVVNDAGSCAPDSALITILIELCESVESINGSNPVCEFDPINEVLLISNPDGVIEELLIFDIAGKVVLRESIAATHGGKYKISIAHLLAGSYIVTTDFITTKLFLD